MTCRTLMSMFSRRVASRVSTTSPGMPKRTAVLAALRHQPVETERAVRADTTPHRRHRNSVRQSDPGMVISQSDCRFRYCAMRSSNCEFMVAWAVGERQMYLDPIAGWSGSRCTCQQLQRTTKNSSMSLGWLPSSRKRSANALPRPSSRTTTTRSPMTKIARQS